MSGLQALVMLVFAELGGLGYLLGLVDEPARRAYRKLRRQA